MYPFTFKSFFFSTASCSGISNGPLINYTTGFLSGFLNANDGSHRRTVAPSHHRTVEPKFLNGFKNMKAAYRQKQVNRQPKQVLSQN